MGRFALCGGFFCLVKSPGKLLEDVDHLLVRNLAETSVIKTDGAEKRVVFEADNVIGLAAQLVERACRCYRHGQNHFLGLRVRVARRAALVVAPVAMPSSTTIAVQPPISRRSWVPR